VIVFANGAEQARAEVLVTYFRKPPPKLLYESIRRERLRE
jgi:hypothetical protein